MLDALLRLIVQGLLSLRYRVRLTGLDAVRARGRRGILFLPNHPALIDPVIVMAWLHKDFRPGPLADRDQVSRPGIGWMARRVGVRPIADLAKYGPGARQQIEAVVQDCVAGLRAGDNVLLYPSGHLYRSRLEDLRGNSSVESIIRALPDVRIVLVRTRGLWGSSFGMASGSYPHLREVLWRGVRALLANFIFLTPRREVSIELHEPDDLPRTGERAEINAFIERFYNADAPPNRYVPYTIWEGGGPRDLPDPVVKGLDGDAIDVPETTRQLVLAQLRQMTGIETIRDGDKLGADLGLDSLARTELIVWLGKEFGFHAADAASLNTVADVLLAARGQSGGARIVELKPVPKAWFAPRSRERVATPSGDTITDVFLAQARRGAGRVAVADQISGARTYRDLITAILALRAEIAALPGERIGLMLPAGVGATVAYLAALFSGKTPVLLNWTTGARSMEHALRLCGVERVLTAGALLARLEAQGIELGPIRERCVLLEQIGARLGRGRKLGAALQARLNWSALQHATPTEFAAILLTSGSESLPKAVPLTHVNILTNIRDVLNIVTVRDDDALIGFLPPFHSFGLTVTTLLPLLSGVRVVFHANPTEPWVIARMIEAYRASVTCGTPTFLMGIVRASTPGQLAPLRLAVTGAEKCPERTYEALGQACPKAVILEGYGVTECSPVIAANREESLRHGTIGKLLPSFERLILDVDSGRATAVGQTGMLHVRGPCVFPGYLGDGVASPFVELEGARWYRTGDLVSEAADGVMTFRGRLKRFVKLGGEMISLPAIETVLEQHYAAAEANGQPDKDGPLLAVEATPSEDQPEIVLFARLALDRAAVNQQIRGAGLSPLHNVTRVVQVEAIPVLGTGKTDYRALREMLGNRGGGA